MKGIFNHFYFIFLHLLPHYRVGSEGCLASEQLPLVWEYVLISALQLNYLRYKVKSFTNSNYLRDKINSEGDTYTYIFLYVKEYIDPNFEQIENQIMKWQRLQNN